MWAVYDKWNEAIAEVVFPELDRPRLVYLDLEGDLIEELGKRLSVAPPDVEHRLAEVVSETLLRSAGPSTIFARHLSRLRLWIRGGRADPPPFLGLLAVFCIAAERMAAGGGMSSNNYYGRLRELLGWDANDTRLDRAYQRVAERLWGELNRWLIELDGLRGLPTAYSLSHRYVGLPVSQALIRSTDYEKLKEFFRQYGFAPGSDVAPSDLVLLLGDWIGGNPSPVSTGLQRLWSQSSSRNRIAEAAAVSLGSWDGSVRERAGGEPHASSGTLALTLEIGNFPRKRLILSALFFVNCAGTARTATVLTANPPADIDIVPDLPGALGLGIGSSLHAGDVLEGVLRIRDNLTQRVVERRPRRLVVFREDDLSRRWIESPQVMLGDSVRLLAHQALLPRLEEVLSQIARPGWQVLDPYPGQPEGWIVLTDVEIFSHPGSLVNASKMDDFLPLIPLTSSQLKATGGFALPGRVRGKWHSWIPPEIRAISDAPDGFVVRLIDTHRFDEVTDEIVESVVEEWSDEGTGVVVRSLADCDLVDGDYRVELVPTGSTSPLTTTSILLRSSDTPELRQRAALDSIEYADGIGVLGIGSRSEVAIKGHEVPSAHPVEVPAIEVPTTPRWTVGRHTPRAPRSPLRITVPDSDSCIRTGRHVEIVETVPTDSRGRPSKTWSHGRCKGCGLVRRYPTRLKRPVYGRLPHPREQTAPASVMHDLTAVAPAAHDSHHDYATAFDALLHTGGGPWSQLERIALQIEPTALFVDHFARNLEALGHIDVQRNPRTLQPVCWEVCPTALIGTGTDYLFAGYWPNVLYAAVGQQLAGYEFRTKDFAEAPTQYFVNGVSLPDDEVRSLAEKDVVVIDHAWRDLVSFLPPLSEVLAQLPRQPASFDGEITWFNTEDTSWVTVSSMDGPGAYRVRRFSTVDLVRSTEDVRRGTVARSTVQLSKHLAALMEGRPLLAYDRSTASLWTPLGADLPGLYGRAAVASSGSPPVALRKDGLLKYESVPEELARHLYDLLSR